MKPLIGLSASCREGEFFLKQTYLDAVVAAGGIPVMIPCFALGDGAELLRSLDGLLLTGGTDIDSSRYCCEAHPKTCPGELQRDLQELELLSAAFARKLPVFGICRGMQMLNIYLGGTLIQDIPERFSVEHNQVTHPVLVKEDSFLFGILGIDYHSNSTHHQCIGRSGAGLRPIAWSEEGIVEAVELLSRENVFGVQWHPERMRDAASGKLFRRLVGFAKEYHRKVDEHLPYIV